MDELTYDQIYGYDTVDVVDADAETCPCSECQAEREFWANEPEPEQSFEALLFEATRTLDSELTNLLELSYQRGYSDALAENPQVTYEDAAQSRVESVLAQLDEWAPFIEGEIGGLNARFDSLVEAVADIVEGQDERLDLTEVDAPVVESLLLRVAEVEARLEELEDESEA